jgi:DNA-binding transcriptional LysR family regulator
VPLELRQLRYFVAVVEDGQVSRAARRLMLAQPALSQAIATLERQVGVRLLNRHARGVSPTAAGAVFLVHARAAVAAADAGEASMQAWVRGERGQLAIGFLPMGLEIVGAILQEFRRDHGDVEVIGRELDYGATLSGLRAGAIDLELVTPLPSEPDIASRTNVTFDELADETFPGVHPSVPEEFADAHLLLSQRQGRRPTTTVETPLTPDETWSLIVTRRAITLGPALLAPRYARNGVVAVPVSDVEPLEIGLALRAEDRRPVIESFVEAARSACAAFQKGAGPG